jgi:hypothetical protein
VLVIEPRDYVLFSVVQTVMEFERIALGWVGSTVGKMFRFRFYSSHYIHRRRMGTYQHTAFADLDIYFTADTKATPASVQTYYKLEIKQFYPLNY